MRCDDTNNAAHFSREFGAGRRNQFDVIKPGPAGGTSPAAEQTVDRYFAHLAGIEIELDLGPIIIAGEWFGTAAHWILHLMDVQHRAIGSPNLLHFFGFDPAGELVVGALFHGNG